MHEASERRKKKQKELEIMKNSEETSKMHLRNEETMI